MAASTTPRPKPAEAVHPAVNPAEVALAGLDLPLPVAVAFSGGADSSVLLLAAAARWPGQVSAIHVHHGLQAAADDFELHCVRACAALGVPLHVVRVDARNASGESPEDAARRARYAALAEAAQQLGAQAVLLGQHADDQVETLLIALSRGAGLPGLAGMAPGFERHGMQFVRPLLAVGGDQIRAWAAAEGLPVVQDPSNADTRLTRNRIRHLVLPALEQALPQFRETFARTARHAAQARELLEQLAAQDLAVLGVPPAIQPLRALGRARQANLLRHWLRSAHAVAPSAAQLDELLAQVRDCATAGHAIRIKAATGFVVRRGAVLVFEPPAQA